MDIKIVLGIILVFFGFSFMLFCILLLCLRKNRGDLEGCLVLSKEFYEKCIGGFLLAGLGIVVSGIAFITNISFLFLPCFMLVVASLTLLIPVDHEMNELEAKWHLKKKE